MYFKTILFFFFTYILPAELYKIHFKEKDAENCKTPEGYAGKCLPLKNCPNFQIKNGPSGHCGFVHKAPIVCCPVQVIELRSKQDVSAPDVNFKCGQRGSRRVFDRGFPTQSGHSPTGNYTDVSGGIEPPTHIGNSSEPPPEYPDYDGVNYDQVVYIAGGVESTKNSWPWMALLGKKVGEYENKFFCSGILINADYVLTAAHCILDPSPMFVRLGEHNYDPAIEDAYSIPEDIPVQGFIFHPDYNHEIGYHDLALLKLESKVSFKDEIRPICLPWNQKMNEDLVGEEVTITGWGTTDYGSYSSTHLREVNVTVFDPSTCHRSYSTLREFDSKFPQGLTKANIMCAGDSQGQKDACQGDSGGPMMHYDALTDSFNLAGVISKGYGCGLAEFPGLYAPIRSIQNLRWIKDVAF